MIPDIAIAREAAIAFKGAWGMLFSTEFARARMGLTSINMMANINSDAVLRPSVFNFTNSPLRLRGRYGPVKLVGAIQGR